MMIHQTVAAQGKKKIRVQSHCTKEYDICYNMEYIDESFSDNNCSIMDAFDSK